LILPRKDKQPGIREECGLFVPKQETRVFGRLFSGGGEEAVFTTEFTESTEESQRHVGKQMFF
jgi:hypothetical protein